MSAILVGRAAAVLFVLCGILGLGGIWLPLGRGADTAGLFALSIAAIAVGIACWFLPWDDWPRWSMHLAVPVAFALIALAILCAGDFALTLGILFCAVFALVGIAHRRGTSLIMLPLFAAACIFPVHHLTGDILLAVTYAVMVGLISVAVGETIAYLVERLGRSRFALSRAHAAVNEMSADLASVDSHGLAWSASARLAQLLEVPNVDVYLLADEGALICLARILDGKPDHSCDAKREVLSTWDAGMKAVHTNKAVFARSDGAASGSAVPQGASHGNGPTANHDEDETLVLPLVSRGKAVGIVEMTTGNPGWTVAPDKVATAESVCRLIALSLQDAEALGAEKALASRLASMLESSRAVASAKTLEEGLTIVVHQAAEALGVTGCAAYEHLPELDAVVARAVWERTPTQTTRPGRLLPLGDRPAERALLASGRPLLENVSDPALDPASRANMVALGEKARLAVPMISVDGVMGLLVFFDTQRECALAEEDMALVGGLADLAGESIRSAQLLRKLQDLSTTDSLTGLANHRHFHEMLEREHARAARNGKCFSLVMLDIDGFKLLNDTYGHPCGDDALRHVAEILRNKTRKTDVVGRYGGDEFVLILPETDEAKAGTLVNKIQKAFAASPFSAPSGDSLPIQSSFGIACYPKDGKEVNELVVAADTKLYISKRSGGNVVTGASGEQDSEPDLIENFGLLEAMLTAVDNKDRYTRRHSIEVTEYALDLATALGLSDDTLRVVRAAGLLHDVGKIAIPDRILRKPGRLTDAEFEVVKGHPSMGASLIRSMPDLGEINAAVISHHERFDGTGYPQGLVGPEIPLLARVLAIADAYSAMTADRPYRKALTRGEALAEIAAGAGTQFDPEMTSTFLACLDSRDSTLRPSRTLPQSAHHEGVR